MLAKALGERRNDVIIASKVGHFRGTAEHAYEAPAHPAISANSPLRNLKTDTIDIYYFPPRKTSAPTDCYLDEAVEMFFTLAG